MIKLNMTKLKKKLAMGTLATALLVGVVGANTAFASTADSYWSFEFGGVNTNNQNTTSRLKENSTSAWMQVTKTYNQGTSSFNAYLMGPDNQNFTINPAQFTGTGAKYITNNAYEYSHGSVSVHIKGVAPYRSGANWDVLGWWSPDSI